MGHDESFFRTTFSELHVEELRAILQLGSDEDAKIIANRITDLLIFCHFAELSRKQLPNAKDAKFELRRFRSAIKTVTAVLRGPMAIALVPPSFKEVSCSSMVLAVNLRESRQNANRICAELQEMNDRAKKHLEDDNAFRFNNFLPPANLSKAQSSTQSIYLGPGLVEIWEDCGQAVGDTRNARLKQFFDLVHEVAGLAPASESEVRSAVKRFCEPSGSARSKG